MEEGPFHFWSEQSVISHNLKMISDLLTEYHRTWFKGEDVDLDASSEWISIRFLIFFGRIQKLKLCVKALPK